MLFLLFGRLYEYRCRAFTALPVFLLWTCLTAAINTIGNPFLNLVYTALSINLVNVILYKADRKKRLLYNNLILFILFFCDTAAVSLWMIIQNNSFSYIIHDGISKLSASLFELVFLFLAYQILLHTLCHVNISGTRIKQVFFLGMILLFEILSLGIYAVKSSSGDDGIAMAGILLCFFLLNMAFLGFLKEISELCQYKYELSLAKKQNELQLAHYQEINRNYQDSKRIIHDIKKHLAAILELQNEDRKRAETYCGLIREQVDGLFYGFQCRNELLSIIMGQKISLAENCRIQVETEIEDLSLEFMSDIDITGIFANLWDNAIEACRKSEHENSRWIRMQMKKQQGFLLICMENSFHGAIKKSGRQFLSTKEGHEGIGIDIIQNTVEKYDGVFFASYMEETFQVRITIPMK